MHDKSPLKIALRLMAMLLPGDYLKTFFYLSFIAKPRKALRAALNTFYRMDHIYDVLKEFKASRGGKFSVLEFGTANGYSFTKMLYATKYLKMEDRVMVHGFDSFEGLAAPNRTDMSLYDHNNLMEGDYRGDDEDLINYCRRRYTNFEIHKGYFEDTLTEDFLGTLKTYLPILVWIDCDYYSSSRTVFERLVPYLPNGCVIYFDDLENFNYGSRFTGEAKLVDEINKGMFGNNIELIRDASLSLNTQRIYRFINYEAEPQFDFESKIVRTEVMNRRTNDSPLP